MSIIQLFKPNSRELYCKTTTTIELNATTFTTETLNTTAIDAGTIVADEYNSRYGNYIKNSYLIWQKLWEPLQFNMRLGFYEKINIFTPEEEHPSYTGSNILNCARGHQYEIDISYTVTVENANSACALFFRLLQGQGGYFSGTMGLTTDFTTLNSPYQGIIKVIFTIESYNSNTGECKINYTYTQSARNNTSAQISNYTVHQTIEYGVDSTRFNMVLPLDFGIIMSATTGSNPQITISISNTKVIQTC